MRTWEASQYARLCTALTAFNKGLENCCKSTHARLSDVLAWLGPEATGFGLALGGFGFWDPQAKP
jgi:hypothetical protein